MAARLTWASEFILAAHLLKEVLLQHRRWCPHVEQVVDSIWSAPLQRLNRPTQHKLSTSVSSLWRWLAECTFSQAAHQAFECILYVYKTENTTIRRTCASRVTVLNKFVYFSVTTLFGHLLEALWNICQYSSSLDVLRIFVCILDLFRFPC